MPLPIGFFSPLPLPVMIPFMALQSFAMMYAAGTGWQYGKRKISSKTNEDFNNLTPVQLNAEILGSIHDMIPSFEQSAQDMSEMNKVIFEQMRLMISDATNFFGDLVFGMFQGISKQITDFGSQDITDISLTSASPPPAITNISHTVQENVKIDVHNWRHSLSEINSLPIHELESLLQYNNYNESDERKAIFNQLQKLKKNLPNTPTGQLAPSLTKNETEAKAFTTWQANRIRVQKLILINKGNIATAKSRLSAQDRINIKRWEIIIRDHRSELRTISNDYRSPNNGIRTAAIQLRQEIANGKW